VEKAKWAERGRLVWFGHQHEPPIFLKRRGLWNENVIRMWEEGHSESYIRRLAECGCTNINTHFFKGFGLEVERDHIEELKVLVKLCRKYGIKVNGYTQFGTIVPETILDEVPEAVEWPRRDPSGKPITMGPAYYRWKPCYSRQGFIDYIKKCITVGVKEVGLDGIFLDNTSIIGCFCPSCVRYEGCWCEECQEGFRRFLERRYPDAKASFGIPSFRRLEIPPDITNRSEPMVREYFDFVGELIRARLKELLEHTKSLSERVALAANGTTIPHLNSYLLGDVHEISFVENFAFPRVEDGCLIHLVPFCKMASAAGLTLVKLGYYPAKREREEVYWNPASDFRLSMAEGMAFGAHSPQTPWLERLDAKNERDARVYLSFYKRHQDFYVGAEPAAVVAILYPYKAIVRDPEEALACFQGLQQVLIQNQIPYELIYREQLKERLHRFRVLALSDYPPLSDEEAEIIRQFVKKGGGLYASGRTSLCDERYVSRANYALADLFGADFEGPGGSSPRRDFEVRPYGKGKVCFLNWAPEKIVFLDIDGKPFEEPGKHCWTWKVKCKLPERHSEIARTMRALCSGGHPIDVVAPRTVAVDVYRKDGDLFLHLLNYDVDCPKEHIHVSIDRRWFKGGSVRLYAPELKGSKVLPSERDGSFLRVIVPRLEVYAVVRVSGSV